VLIAAGDGIVLLVRWPGSASGRRVWHLVELEIRSGASEDLRSDFRAVLFGQLICVIVHDNSHAVQTESIRLGHHALSEPIRHMIRAKEPGDHDTKVNWDKAECDRKPFPQDNPLKVEEALLASREDSPRVASLADSRLDEWAEVPATAQPVLDAETTEGPEVSRPLGVDLPFEVERFLLVSDVSGGDHECEDDPEQEGVYGKEGAIVEQNTGPSDDGGDDPEEGCHSRENEFGSVGYADDVGACPDIKPRKKTKDKGDRGI